MEDRGENRAGLGKARKCKGDKGTEENKAGQGEEMARLGSAE